MRDSTSPGPLARLRSQLGHVIKGKTAEIDDALTCLLAGGHLLIEDVPGVGKTTLAQALAISMGLAFSRVQFTADLLPADLLGVTMLNAERQLAFHPGPVFTQVLLADEINRAGPRTQSALLEAMEERQVTVDGRTHALPEPFFVIATQNPAHQLGTHPLPESQLDRFMLRIRLGLPDAAAERDILRGQDSRTLLRGLAPAMTPQELLALQQQAAALPVSDALLDYLQALLAATRSGRWFVEGLSPRAGIAVLRAARARALLAGRAHVSPDDVQAILPQAVAHRLVPVAGSGRGAVEQVRAMVEATALQ